MIKYDETTKYAKSPNQLAQIFIFFKCTIQNFSLF